MNQENQVEEVIASESVDVPLNRMSLATEQGFDHNFHHQSLMFCRLSYGDNICTDRPTQ